MDYLVTMTTHVPDGVTEVEVAAVREREAAHTADLARAGQVLRLWRRRYGRTSGARSASSPPTTTGSSGRCSPGCRCGSGARTR